MADIRSPFKDGIADNKVPTTGSGPGKVYEQAEGPGLPTRVGGEIRELYRDNGAGGSGPKTSGPIKTPFKDSVS